MKFCIDLGGRNIDFFFALFDSTVAATYVGWS
jgi:hypothetical protein